MFCNVKIERYTCMTVLKKVCKKMYNQFLLGEKNILTVFKQFYQKIPIFKLFLVENKAKEYPDFDQNQFLLGEKNSLTVFQIVLSENSDV